ncbi:MAG: hypothetical protein NZM06_07595 [Chloroherpetonaceae bacterium]|nr:hypothetical protein [Chloroherpetonaceae bacterium]MDW8437558.1 hypothetical protein [Chloroherpetonaceae bacterium]
MQQYPFPSPDPIPLPAPVWLFKVLNVVTLALHFVALEILIGGLLIVAVLNYFGAREGASLRLNQAAHLMARRLPIVMTYVINLGVPPLLFTQVMYGQALYTSSILIGLWWFSVIVMLMIAYWLLYKVAERVEARRNAWLMALGAWLFVGFIARIYSTNFTLMLRPEDWQGLYEQSALGAVLPMNDPTTTPRWLTMLAGGFAVAGVWMIWLSTMSKASEDVGAYLNALGGKIALVAFALQLGAGYWVYLAQPDAVKERLGSQTFYLVSGYGWVALTAVLMALSALAIVKKPSPMLSWSGAAAALLAMLAMVNCRDGIRDVTLLSKGFDVWERNIVTNWSVVAIFLALFVVGLGVLGWLISVVMRSKEEGELKLNPSFATESSKEMNK